MRSSTWRLEDLRNVILNLGFVGENLHTRQIFDCKKMFDQYPNASVSMTVTPPEGEPYPGLIERDGDRVIWDVRDCDLVAEGDGEIQIVFTQEPHIARSYNARTHVCRSQVPTGDVPSGLDDFVTRADQLLDEVKDTFPAGGTTGQVLAKKSDADYDTEWVPQGGGGTEDYDELENRPQIGGVTLTGNKSLHDLGAAAESDIPDLTDLIDDTAGSGDTDKVWSADKSHALLTEINSVIPYKSLSGMRSADELVAGKILQTEGYYSSGDGGGAKYLVRAKEQSDTDDAATKIIIGNYVAELMPENGAVNALAFGIKRYTSNSLTGIDDTSLLNKAIAYSSANKIRIYFPKGKYYFSEVNLVNKNGAMIEGENGNINTDAVDQLTCFVAIGTPTNDAKAFIATNTINTKNNTTYEQLTQTKDVVIRNIYLWINTSIASTRDYGVFAGYTTHAVIENLRIRNFAQGVYLNSTWNTEFNNIYVTHYTSLGIQIENTTNMLDCRNLYCNTESSADGALKIYGAHSVKIDNLTCEGGGSHAAIIAEMYPSNANGLVINNMHCENTPVLIKLVDNSVASSFKGLSTGAITIRGGVWSVAYSTSVRLVEVSNDPWYSLRDLTLDNFRIIMKHITGEIEIDPAVFNIDCVDCLREDILWYQLDETTILKESQLMRIHGPKYRYGISESFASGYPRIYNGNANNYTVEHETTEAVTDQEMFPLIDYDDQDLGIYKINVDVIYDDDGDVAQSTYEVEINSSGTVTDTLIDGSDVASFGLSDGFLTVTASIPIRAVCNVTCYRMKLQLITTTRAHVAEFETNATMPLEYCFVEFGYTQSGSGDPSPNNERSLTGRIGLDVYVSPTQDEQVGTTYPVLWQTEAGTIAGGTLDVKTGVLTQTMKLVTFRGESSEGWSNRSTVQGHYRYSCDVSDIEYGSGKQSVLAASWLKADTNGATAQQDDHVEVITGNANYAQIFVKTDVASSTSNWNTYLASHNLQVVYKLATPVEYQIDPETINTLRGTNYIWTEDENGYVTVSYWKK